MVFRKRRANAPLLVGQTMCVLVGDRVYFDQQHHLKLTPEAIAVLAPLTWVLHVAASFQRSGVAALDSWRQALVGSVSCTELNDEINAGGIHLLEQGFEGRGAAAHGEFQLLPDSSLTGVWKQFRNLKLSECLRIYAALWSIADDLGVGSDVRYATSLVCGAQIDYNHPDLMRTLPQQALNHAARMSAWDEAKALGPETWGGDDAEADGVTAPETLAFSVTSSALEETGGERLGRALAAIRELRNAGTISASEAAEMRARAMAAYEAGN